MQMKLVVTGHRDLHHGGVRRDGAVSMEDGQNQRQTPATEFDFPGAVR